MNTLERNRECPICHRHFYVNPNFNGWVDCDNCGGKFYHDQLIDTSSKESGSQ